MVMKIKYWKGWTYDPITKKMRPPAAPLNENFPEGAEKVEKLYVEGGKFKLDYEEK